MRPQSLAALLVRFSSSFDISFVETEQSNCFRNNLQITVCAVLWSTWNWQDPDALIVERANSRIWMNIRRLIFATHSFYCSVRSIVLLFFLLSGICLSGSVCLSSWLWLVVVLVGCVRVQLASEWCIITRTHAPGKRISFHNFCGYNVHQLLHSQPVKSNGRIA